MKLVILIKLIGESLRFALNSLATNVLRTILSLLGVTVGIFAIIAVLTVVDSLERSIKESLDFIGTEVIYIQTMPWDFSGGEYKWWDYIKRPNPSYREFQFLQSKMKNYGSIAIMSGRGNMVAKSGSNTYNQTRLSGGSYGYKDILAVPITDGRYFSIQESENGRNVAILGYNVKDALFQDSQAVGEEIKIRNLKFRVIGVMKQEGESFMGNSSNDDRVIIPYGFFRRMYSTGTGRRRETPSTIALKGRENDIGLVELEYELIGLMRSRRGLKPKQDDNFALNRPEAITGMISGVFDVIGTAGWIIGGFSILVGGFGIANIMFVSVRERTSLIGIQKSLGAKNYFILFQFLFESIFLSLIGGMVGLLIVYLLSFISLGSLDLVLSAKNIILGLGVSSTIGVISGIIPAAVAARMDPVVAIRTTG